MATPILPNETIQPDIDQFILDFNGYLETNKFEIFDNLFYGLEDPGNPYSLSLRATMMDGISRPQLLPIIDVEDVVQKSNSREFNAKGNLELGGRQLTPMGWKIDNSYDYQSIWREYVQIYKTAKRNLIPNEENVIPTLEEVFNRLILKSAGANIREAIYKGEYDASPTNYSHLAFMNGFNKILKDEVTATNLTPVAVLPTSPSDVLPKIKSIYEAMGSAYQRRPDCVIQVASDVWSLVTDVASGFNTSNPTIVINNGNREDISTNILTKPLPFATNVSVVEEPHLQTGGILATIKENLVIGFDSMDPSAQLRARPYHRLINVYGDGMVGVQIRRVKPANGQAPLIVNEAAVA